MRGGSRSHVERRSLDPALELTFVLAAQRGSLAAVSVLGAQYAALSSSMAFLLVGERLRWWQTVGVAASGASVALIALA